MPNTLQCKLCHGEAIDLSLPDLDGIKIACASCGVYGISRTALCIWESHVLEKHLPELIKLLNRKRANGQEVVIFSNEITCL